MWCKGLNNNRFSQSCGKEKKTVAEMKKPVEVCGLNETQVWRVRSSPWRETQGVGTNEGAWTQESYKWSAQGKKEQMCENT